MRPPHSFNDRWVFLLLYILLGGLWLSSQAGSSVTENESRESAATFVWQPSGPFGGEARRLAVDPRRPDVYYLGTGDGQVYRSLDGGQSWRLLQPGLSQPGLSIESLFVDLRASHRLYVGGWDVRGGDGGGVFVSENGGETWVSLPGIQGRAIRALAQSPSRPDVLIAGALDGVFQSEDGGASWRRISPEHHPELKNIESLAVDPRDPTIIYVGTWHLPWKTKDGGKTWELIGGSPVGIVNDSDIFSISVDHLNHDVIYMGACTGVYRSENSGRSWSKIQGIPSTSRRTHVIRQHPARPSVLYAGTTQGLWKSSDHGRRWRLITDRKLVVNDVAIHPLKPEVVMLATDRGIFLSHGDGVHFVSSNNGFSHRTVSTLQLDVENPARVYAGVFSAGSASGLYISEDRGRSWRELGEGLRGMDVFCFLQSPQSPRVMYAGTSRGLYRSLDRGRLWRQVIPTEVVKAASGKEKAASSAGEAALIHQRKRRQLKFNPREKVLALTPLPDRHTILLLTEKGLYRARLDKGLWERIYRAGVGERLLAVITSGAIQKTIYLGTNEGLRISRDGGMTWDPLAVDGQPYPVQAIAEDARHPVTVYVGTSYGLFRLLWPKGEATWNRCGSGLPPISVSAIKINPGNGDEVVVGDQRHGGLYRSMDRGQHWERIDSGFASARIYTLTFDGHAPASLYVGTLNGGVHIGRMLPVVDSGVEEGK